MAIENGGFAWLQDLVFTFQGLLIQYDPQKCEYQEVLESVKRIESDLLTSKPYAVSDHRTFEILTVFGGSFGPDLERVAMLVNRTPDAVVQGFSSTIFTVYFLGFLGAQPYLGGLPEYFRVPRLNTPRSKVLAGSIGIGGLQAGIVTIDQPSGFNFIGWTPLSLYDPEAFPPSNLSAGDRLIFREITADEAVGFRGKKPEQIVPKDKSLA